MSVREINGKLDCDAERLQNGPRSDGGSLLLPDRMRRDASTVATAGHGRLYELDGIRGWAAVAVVVFHVFYETFGAIFPSYRNPLATALNGRLSVYVFFVLSGEALSAGYFGGGGIRAIASLAVKRHSRLTIPIFASILLLWTLQSANLVFSAEAAPIVHRQDWLSTLGTRPITLARCIRYSMVDVYTFSNSESHIIPFLWTMSAEMLGSIFVFALLPIWRHVSRKTLLAPVLGVILLSSPNTAFLAAFTAGVAFAAARTSGFTEHVSQLRYAQTGSLIGMFLVLVAVGSGRTFDARFNAAAAMVITGMIFVNRGARAFFSCRPSRWLGSISFPLYLTHASVLCSLTSYLIVVYRNHLSLSVSLGIGLASVGTTILVAAAFMPIERLTKHVGHVLSAAFVPVKPEDGTAI